jgi:hypothetical protein
MPDPLPVRLGGLAAHLARIQSYSNHLEHRDPVESLLEKGKYLLEWAAPDASLNVQAARVGR